MEETAEVVRRLFAGDRSGFVGDHFTLAPDTGFGYTPQRDRIPLTIGTWKPRMAALAGRIADEVKIGGCANPDMVRLMREWIGNDDVGIVVGAVTVVDEDGDRARAYAQREVAMYLEVVGANDPTSTARRRSSASPSPARQRRSRHMRAPLRRGRKAGGVRHATRALDCTRRRAAVRPGTPSAPLRRSLAQEAGPISRTLSA